MEPRPGINTDRPHRAGKVVSESVLMSPKILRLSEGSQPQDQIRPYTSQALSRSERRSMYNRKTVTGALATVAL